MAVPVQYRPHLHTSVSRDTDFNFPSKATGYMALDSTVFSFVGLDNRAVEWLNDFDQDLRATNIVRSTGVSNYI